MKKLVSFDWAAKKLLRSKANFGILEGFLSELLYEDIKIKQLLESESNKDKKDSKLNRVDLLVENTKGELIIIEIQNQREADYFQRMLFGTSKLVVDFLPESSKYALVKKIISVNIVYFDLGQGNDYIYKGTTSFVGMNTHDILNLSDDQKAAFEKDTISEILPEYYILKVNQFNDIAKNSLDQWIYFLKNEEIKSNFKAKGIIEAKEKLDVMKMSDEELRKYKGFKEELRDIDSWNFTYYEVPMKQGFEKGIKHRDNQIVISMNQEGFSINQIMKVTGLSKEEIEKILKN